MFLQKFFIQLIFVESHLFFDSNCISKAPLIPLFHADGNTVIYSLSGLRIYKLVLKKRVETANKKNVWSKVGTDPR